MAYFVILLLQHTLFFCEAIAQLLHVHQALVLMEDMGKNTSKKHLNYLNLIER